MENIKFIVRHVDIVNDTNNAIEALNNDIDSNWALDENTISKYSKELATTSNFEYSFKLFCMKTKTKSVSCFTQLGNNLISKTIDIIEAVKKRSCDTQQESIEIALNNLQVILRLSSDQVWNFQEKILSLIKNHVRQLQEEFNSVLFDLCDYDGLENGFESSRKVLIYECLIDGAANNEEFNSMLEGIFKSVKEEIVLKLNECVEKLEEGINEGDSLQIDYEKFENCLLQLQNYDKFIVYLQDDQIGKNLDITESNKSFEIKENIKSHATLIQTQFNESFDYIEQNGELANEKETLESAKTMKKCLEAVETVQSFEAINELFPDSLVNGMNELLSDKLYTLEIEIDTLVSCEELQSLPDKLFVSKTLGICDARFKDLFAKFNQQTKDLKKQIYNKCCDDILRFSSLKECIDQFNENDPVDKYYLKKLKEKLSEAVKENLESVKELESFEDIGKALKVLGDTQKGQKSLGSFLNNDFSDLESEVKESINKQVEEFLEKTVELIENLEMTEAEDNISKLSDILKKLKKHEIITDETLEKINELKSNQKDLVDVENFQEYDLATCCEKALEVYENLKKFPQSLNDLDSIIIGKFSAELTNNNDHLKDYLPRLPESLQAQVETLITEHEQKLDHDLDVQFNEAELLISKFLKTPSFKGFNLKEDYELMERLSTDDSVKFSDRFSGLADKINELVVNTEKNFNKSLEKCDVTSLRNHLETIEFIIETNEIAHETCSYELIKQQLVDKLNEISESFLTDFYAHQNNKSLIHFEKFFEDLATKLEVLKDAARLLDEKIETLDLVEVVNDCTDYLKRKIETEYENGRSNLRSVLNDGGDETVKPFIANFYNLVSFESKMHKLVDNETNYESTFLNISLKKVNEIVTEMNTNDLEETSAAFISIKDLGMKLFVFKTKIDKILDKAINDFIKKSGGFSLIGKLGILLKSDRIGSVIMSEHKVFDSFHRSLFNRKTLSQDIEYVLKDITGDDIDTEILRKYYTEFKTIFDNIVEDYLKPVIDFDLLINNLRDIVNSIEDPLEWGLELKQKIPSIIGHLFGLWTLLNSTNYFDMESEGEQFHFIPHPAQIVAIFRMLGIGYNSQSGLSKNLVQIGTGEGKSVTLAITASTMALFGMDTYCVCYSDYLSKRDFNTFEALFAKLELLDRVNYGTFNKICEDVLNRSGDLRKQIENYILNNELDDGMNNEEMVQRQRVLLIDEVDVFFSKDFYGNHYMPSLNLIDPTLKDLITMIWNERENDLNMNSLKETSEFITCIERFGSQWEGLIEEAVKDMLYELKTFEAGHEYVVLNDKIGYKEQDNTVFDISYGYKTLFAYFMENERGKISEDSLNENISILVRLGTFSYAEIPKDFHSILGCSGTLSTLSKPELNIIENIYEIKLKTFIPSVYGRNNLRFNRKENILLENEQNFYKILKQEIEHKILGQNVGTKRAVFVVFDSKVELDTFLESSEYLPLKNDTLVLTEEASIAEKNFIISSATASGKITFFTKIFGRGTDFKVHDGIVSANGGVHVIQTFLSEELSEEIQIKGRTARQSENGSFSMVIAIKSLEKFLINPEDLKENENDLYEYLNHMRCEFFNKKYEENVKHVENIKKKHIESNEFLNTIKIKDEDAIREFLLKQNKGSIVSMVQSSKTLILMDATSSMTNLLAKTKNTLEAMFQRVYEVLESEDLDLSMFQLKIGVYRNYNSKEHMILQSSSWENRSDNLISFLRNIRATDGWGNEAIEIGLWQANEETDLSQVILIADAPANTQQDVYGKRHRFRERWEGSKYSEATYYEDELDKLNEKQIPVHAFYVHQRAKENFEFIAEKTNGKCEWLDIESEDGSEKLTNLINIEVLRNIGGSNLVNCYKNKFNAF